jgi:hypothetical protein
MEEQDIIEEDKHIEEELKEIEQPTEEKLPKMTTSQETEINEAKNTQYISSVKISN